MMSRCHFVLIFILLVTIGQSEKLFSQILPFHYYTTADGLPSNQVSQIFQDSKGYLWICTSNGLCMFDGVSFTSYSILNGLPENDIDGILESPSRPGTLYVIGKKGNLTLMRDGVFSSVKLNTPFQGTLFDEVKADEDSCLWGLAGDKLFAIKNDSAVWSRLPLVFNETRWVHILLPEHGGVWISDGKDLAFYQRTIDYRWEKITTLHFPSVITFAMLESEGNLFITLSNCMLYEVRNRVIGRHRQLPWDGGGPRLTLDHHGILWMTSSTGINSVAKERFDTDPFRSCSVENGLPEQIVSQVLFDREDNLWIASWSRGLAVLTARGISRIPLDPEAGARWGIVDGEGNFWAKAYRGIWQLYQDSNGSWQKILHPLPLSDRTVCFDHNGGFWVISYVGDIGGDGKASFISRYQINGRKKQTRLQLDRRFPYPKELHEKTDIFAALLDRENRLWLGMNRYAVVVFNPETMRPIQTYIPGIGAPDNSVREIFQDRRGRIWFGGWDGGLALVDTVNPLTGKAKIFTMNDGLSDNRIRSIFEDKRGRIWIGTRFGGAAVYENDHFTMISMKDGLLSNAIWSFTEDANGRIWLGTDVGMQAIDGATLRVLPTDNELRLGRVNSCGFYADSILWFVTTMGATMYNVKSSLIDTVQPPLYIKRFFVNGGQDPFDTPQAYPYDQNHCTIEYIAISLKDPNELRYQTMLEGLDRDWNSPIQQRSITYGGLPSGHYKFHVRAINGDGVMSKSDATVSFSIGLPFWKTWWFFSLVIGFVSSAILSLHFYRRKKHQETHRLRERIASDLHDEIGSNLGAISVMSDSAMRDREANDGVREKFNEIASTARETSQLIGDIVWIVKPDHDALGDLVQKMKDMANAMLQNIDCTFQSPEKVFQGKVDLWFRRNVFLIYKEILHNIVKHSEATKVTIVLNEESGIVTLRIEDNGKGCDNILEQKGNGMRNLRHRAEQIHGTLHIESEPGKGSRIHLRAKIP